MTDKIPTDRITDGIDQTALLLMGEGYGRRHYMFHYSGARIGAVRINDMKMVVKGPPKGGIPDVDFFNIMRDPKEAHAKQTMGSGLAHLIPIQRLMMSHNMMIQRFPHRVLTPKRPMEAGGRRKSGN